MIMGSGKESIRQFDAFLDMKTLYSENIFHHIILTDVDLVSIFSKGLFYQIFDLRLFKSLMSRLR